MSFSALFKLLLASVYTSWQSEMAVKALTAAAWSSISTQKNYLQWPRSMENERTTGVTDDKQATVDHGDWGLTLGKQ